MNACIDSCDTTNTDFNNIESLQKGFVYLKVPHFPSNNYIASAKSDLKRAREVASAYTRIAQAVPVRVVCMHLCFPNTEVYKIVGKIVGMACSVFNSRTKIHLGNPVEWQYALQGYGIPTGIIPVTDTGTIKLDNWKKWIKLKKYTEQQEMTVLMKTSTKTSMKTPMNCIVECPGSNDVVFRRGKSLNYHPGNVKFQNMIESQFQHHSDPNTTQARKEAIEIKVIQNVKKDGGRFLKWDSDKGWWINMSVEMSADMDSDIDMDIGNMTKSNSISTSANTKENTNENMNENMNVNDNETLNVNGTVNVKGNVNVSLNSNGSASYTKAEKRNSIESPSCISGFQDKND